jgi:hypothetical protein
MSYFFVLVVMAALPSNIRSPFGVYGNGHNLRIK